MTHRAATIWRNKIADYESTNPAAEIFIEEDKGGYDIGPFWYVVVLDGSGEVYWLYTADECRKWIHDAY